MGVMTRDQSERFVVTSDRILGEPKSIRAAKRLSGGWTHSGILAESWTESMSCDGMPKSFTRKMACSRLSTGKLPASCGRRRTGYQSGS
jgi:hypothetical protein